MRTVWGCLFIGLAACATFDEPTDGASGEGGDDVAGVTSTGGATKDASTTSTADATSSSTGNPLPRTRVHVIDENDDPIQAVLVFATDADGRLVDETKTNASGLGELAMPEGGAVHLGRELVNVHDGVASKERSITSQLGLTVGIDVTFAVPRTGRVSVSDANDDVMDLTVYGSILENGVFGTAASTELSASCGAVTKNTQGWVRMDSYGGCDGESTFSVYALGYDANDQLIAAGRIDDVPFETGEQTSLTVTMTKVQLPAMAFTFVGSAGADVTNTISVLGDGGRYPWGRQSDETGIASIALSAQLPRSLFGSWDISFLSVNPVARTQFMRHSLFASANLPATMSASSSELAAIRMPTFDESAPDGPRVVVEMDAGPEGDYLGVSMSWGTDFVKTTWRAYAAPGDLDTQLPQLPASIAAWTIKPGDQVVAPWAHHVSRDDTASQLDATRNTVWSNGVVYTSAWWE